MYSYRFPKAPARIIRPKHSRFSEGLKVENNCTTQGSSRGHVVPEPKSRYSRYWLLCCLARTLKIVVKA